MKKLTIPILALLSSVACMTISRVTPPAPPYSLSVKIEPTVPLHTSTPAPNPTVPPSAATADHAAAEELPDGEALRQLMLFSHDRWSSLWAEGQVDYYAPGGVAPVQSDRVQIWIQQPARFRVLVGPVDGIPNDQWISDGFNIRQRGETAAPIPPYESSDFKPPIQFSDTIEPHPLSGQIVSPIRDLLFPTALAQRDGIYEVIGREAFAGRLAILLDWSRIPGAVIDRFWVDAETGLILRQMNFGKGGLQGLNSEIVIHKIQYDLDFPESLFSINALMPEGFVASPGEIP